MDPKPETAYVDFTPSIREFLAERDKAAVTCISGANNSGKSLLLKHLRSELGATAYMVSAARFHSLFELEVSKRDKNWLNRSDADFKSHFNDKRFNQETNFFDLNQIMLGLNDEQRTLLFDLCSDLIGSKFELKRTAADNELSARYVDVGGQNAAVSSTGTRLLMTLLGTCLESAFETLLIDEPELGLSPRLQTKLADLLLNDIRRRRYFPHLEHVFIATHSHLFLDRVEITNNFRTTKEGPQITLNRIETISEFHHLQFNLLGNSLESMLFPSAIVVGEGKTDADYLERLISLRFPDKRVIVQQAGNQGVVAKVREIKTAFGDLRSSPMRSRLFVVVDSKHPGGLVHDLQSAGMLPENIVIWSKNGIEYFYPAAILAEVFRCSRDVADRLVIVGDMVSAGTDIPFRKTELVAEVLKRLQRDSVLPEEMEHQLLDKIRAAIE